MSTVGRDIQTRDSWMPVIAMLTIALLAVAALLNGVGGVGVAAMPQQADGHYVELPDLSAAEKVLYADVEDAIERLDLSESGRPESYETYEPLLVALSESLTIPLDQATLARTEKVLSRSLSAEAVEDVVAVLPSFLEYQQAESTLLGLTPGVPRSIEGAYLHLRIQEALRRTFLGEDVADNLYSTHYRMTETHLVRQILMQREDLGEEERRRLIRQQIEAMQIPQSEESAE